jgi:hypothetical protein
VRFAVEDREALLVRGLALLHIDFVKLCACYVMMILFRLFSMSGGIFGELELELHGSS